MDDQLVDSSEGRPSKRPRVLVACERCKRRRQKCDNASPACFNCSRASVACTYSHENAYPSSYVKMLEERLRSYETSAKHKLPQQESSPRSMSEHHMSSVDPASPVTTAPPPGGRLAVGLGLLSSCAGAEPHYFGSSAGLSLAHFVQIAIDLGNSSSDVSLPLLADRPFSEQTLKSKTPQAALPNFRRGSSYIRAYLSFAHPLYPFLDQSALWDLHRLASEHGNGQISALSKPNLALIHLVYAIGSRCLYLLGNSSVSKTTAESHFLSAMEIINDDFKFTSIRSIEITLLLAIHSMRSPSGTSVWHLAGLAIRQCLELGLHKQRKAELQHAAIDHHRRRLFWSAYIFERKTALVLGRPFAVSDDEIDIDIPINVDKDREDISFSLPSSPAVPSSSPFKETSLAYHRFHIILYQIHTQIRLALYQMKRSQSKSQVLERMKSLSGQLEEWRAEVMASFKNASQNSQRMNTGAERRASEESDSDCSLDRDVFHRSAEIERIELLLEFHKARRSLLQPLMTDGREYYPFSTEDYMACADSAGQICQLYRRLHRLSPIPFSLRDLHAVFVAGFTLIYCVCTCPSLYSAIRIRDVGACSTVLYIITEQWPSAKKYRDAFEVVADRMMESTQKIQQPMAAPSQMALCRRRSNTSNDISEPTLNSLSVNDVDAYNAHRGSSGIPTLSHDCDPARESYSAPMPGTPQSFERPLLDTAQQRPSSCEISSQGLNFSASNSGFELDLAPDFGDVEGLLSIEGLDWFTGTVV